MSNHVFDPAILAEAKKKIDESLQQEAEKHVTKAGYDIKTAVGQAMIQCFIAGHDTGGKDFLAFFAEHV